MVVDGDTLAWEKTESCLWSSSLTGDVGENPITWDLLPDNIVAFLNTNVRSDTA